MARPRKLTDEQRLENDAARRIRWRNKNRVVEKLRARNDRAKVKGGLVEEVAKPVAVVEAWSEPVEIQETSYVPLDEVEGWQPPAPIVRQVAQVIKPVEKTDEERSVEAKLARMMTGKKF